MSWETAGKNRWTWTADDDQHLLALVDGELRELHGTSVHVYAPDEAEPDDDAPLASARHQRTVTKVSAPAGDAEAFVWLEQGRYDRG